MSAGCFNHQRQASDWLVGGKKNCIQLVVGTAGMLSCFVVGVVGIGSSILFHSDFGLPDPPLFGLLGILLYGVLANLCFTGGWVAELIVRRVSPQEADRLATLSFTLGLVFSVLLTLAPGIVVGAAGIFGVVRHFFGAVSR